MTTLDTQAITELLSLPIGSHTDDERAVMRKEAERLYLEGWEMLNPSSDHQPDNPAWRRSGREARDKIVTAKRLWSVSNQ